MDIKWLGHSCFLLTGQDGTRILMDPCDPATGYEIQPVEVDAVTSSHDHHDHNYLRLALGENVRRITEPGTFSVKGATIIGFPTWHDNQGGVLRGGTACACCTRGIWAISRMQKRDLPWAGWIS